MLNRIGAVVMVKNEADIIESFARHILKIADFLIVTDHDSTDRTVEILQSLIEEGLPIELQFLHEIGRFQEREINRMIHQSFEMGADIVLPVDADEFFVKLDGEVRDIRKIFQNLDPSESYSIRWDDYKLLEPEKDQDRFILKRPLSFDRSNPEYKVIVGRESILQNDLFVFRGNHHVVSRRELYGNLMFRNFEIPIEVENLLSLHIPNRSQAQYQSKTLQAWITYVARMSINSMFGRNYRDANAKIFNGEQFEIAAAPNSKPLDLSKYHCELRFTDGKVDPWKNLYRLSEKLADRFCRQKIRAQKIPVTIFVIHHGDANATLKTLESVSMQTHEHLEVFVLPISTDNLDLFQDFVLEDLSKSHGKFIQFVPAGDLLAPYTVEEFLSILEPQDFIRCAISIQQSEADSLDIFENSNVRYIFSLTVLELFLLQKRNFNIDLASFFYRREFILDADWIAPIIASEKSRVLFLDLIIHSVLDGMICILKRDLIFNMREYLPEDTEIFFASYERALKFYQAHKDEVE